MAAWALDKIPWEPSSLQALSAHLRTHGLNVEGDPHVISMCHCQVCQRRTGSPYTVHAYFSRSCVKIEGSPKAYSRTPELRGVLSDPTSA